MSNWLSYYIDRQLYNKKYPHGNKIGAEQKRSFCPAPLLFTDFYY